MEVHLKLIGGLLLVLALLHGVFPRYFKWNQELSVLSVLTRQIFQVHTFFIALVVFLMGALCLTSSEELVSTSLGRKICLGLGVFWSLRLLFQLFVYSSALWRGKMKETVIHVLFTLTWLYLSGVFILVGRNEPSEVIQTSTPFELGVIEEIHSALLQETRVLNIYLPESYSASDSLEYPVIYVLDGSYDEDFIHIAGLVQFNTFPWIGQIPESIVVGIANVDRKRDLSFPTSIKEDKEKYPTSGSSAKFISFLAEEVQPFIDTHYRTSSSRMLIGQSMAGMLATEILFTRPTLFDKYVIISPSLWWDNRSLLAMQPEIFSATFTSSTDIYIGVGNEGPTPHDSTIFMQDDARALADKISAAANPAIKVVFDYLPEEDHSTVTHHAVFRAFRLLYPELNRRHPEEED